jgi:hypothetical protein
LGSAKRRHVLTCPLIKCDCRSSEDTFDCVRRRCEAAFANLADDREVILDGFWSLPGYHQLAVSTFTRICRYTMGPPTTGGSIKELGWSFQPFRINDLELVAQIGPRWNRLANWLREAERFSTAA